MEKMSDFLFYTHFKDLIDVAVVGLLLWGAIAWARRVHAILALVGLSFLGLFYVAALQLELQLTAWFFQGFFAVLVIFLVVVFQDDLRRLFERIAVLGLRRRPALADPSRTAILVRTVQELARRRWGALVVLPGRDPVERHLQGGIELDADPSEELLLSLFDASSPGHDGAVLWQNDRVVRFAAHLPLSENREELGPGGTRHAAALGLAERCDALCLVVSEERGTIGVASAGSLRILSDPSQLRAAIDEHQPGGQSVRSRLPVRLLLRRVLEAGLSFALALAAWLVLVPGAAKEQAMLKIPVTVDNLPAEFELVTLTPDSVSIEVSGPRRELLLAAEAEFELVINADLARLGRRTFSVQREQVQHQTELKILKLSPQKVLLSLKKAKGNP
ncbi:MAG: diadenylate cyclase [Candidatus Latescibacterota bacterium]|jgi:diadenylate cyclase